MAKIPDCGIDLAGFEVFREDQLLCVQTGGKGREHGGGLNYGGELH
jgi:hypothetical protein